MPFLELNSPAGNTKKEMKDKLLLYQEAGVFEYWMIDPYHEFVLLYQLDEKGHYISSFPYVTGDTVASKVLRGFQLEIDLLF